jgi:hypothetical protein
MRKLVIGSPTPGAPAVTAHGALGGVVQRFLGGGDRAVHRKTLHRCTHGARAGIRRRALTCRLVMVCKMVQLDRRQRLHNAY